MASLNDKAAEEFLVYATSVGVECVLVQEIDDLNKVDVSINAGQDGTVAVDMTVGVDHKKVRAVLNRMTINSLEDTPDDQFRAS